MSEDRSRAQGERRLGRPSRPGEGMRQPSSIPSSAPLFEHVDGSAKPARSGGLFKSPFPTAPTTPGGRRIQERPPYADEPDEVGEPEVFAPPMRQRDGRSGPNARGSRRSRPPTLDDLRGIGGEEADGFTLPPRRGRDREAAYGAPRRRSRDPQRGPERIPPGKPGIPASREVASRPSRIVLKVVLAVFLLGACSSTAFAVARFYHVYTVAQSVTGKTLPTVGTTKGNVQPTALPDTLSGINSFNMLLLG